MFLLKNDKEVTNNENCINIDILDLTITDIVSDWQPNVLTEDSSTSLFDILPQEILYKIIRDLGLSFIMILFQINQRARQRMIGCQGHVKICDILLDSFITKNVFVIKMLYLKYFPLLPYDTPKGFYRVLLNYPYKTAYVSFSSPFLLVEHMFDIITWCSTKYEFDRKYITLLWVQYGESNLLKWAIEQNNEYIRNNIDRLVTVEIILDFARDCQKNLYIVNSRTTRNMYKVAASMDYNAVHTINIYNNYSLDNTICRIAVEKSNLFVLKLYRSCTFDWNWPFTTDYGWAWSSEVTAAAAVLGNLDILMYCMEEETSLDFSIYDPLGKGGHLASIMYIKNKGILLSSRMCEMAAQGNHLSVIKYFKEVGCSWDSSLCCVHAVINNNIDMLKYCIRNGNGWNCYTLVAAILTNNWEILELCSTMKDCPWSSLVGDAAVLSRDPRFIKICREHGCLNNSMIFLPEKNPDNLVWTSMCTQYGNRLEKFFSRLTLEDDTKSKQMYRREQSFIGSSLFY